MEVVGHGEGMKSGVTNIAVHVTTEKNGCARVTVRINKSAKVFQESFSGATMSLVGLKEVAMLSCYAPDLGNVIGAGAVSKNNDQFFPRAT